MVNYGYLKDTLIEDAVEEGVLKSGTKAIDFKIDGKKATLDMSKEFVDLLNSYGTSGEGLTVNSLVYTVTTYFNLDSIKITYNSKSFETGHCIYDEELSFGEYTGEFQ